MPGHRSFKDAIKNGNQTENGLQDFRVGNIAIFSLVVSNDVGNRHSTTVIIAAITSKAMKTILPTHCVLGATNGLDRDSIVLLEQIRTIDKQRLRDYVGVLGQRDMQGVDRALAISVGLRERARWWR
jgi:mRNA interferase MazF